MERFYSTDWYEWVLCRVFHQFGQAKFDNSGSIFSLIQFFVTASAALKDVAPILSGQNRLKIIGLISWSKSVKFTV
jgi:hypothetical protein